MDRGELSRAANLVGSRFFEPRFPGRGQEHRIIDLRAAVRADSIAGQDGERCSPTPIKNPDIDHEPDSKSNPGGRPGGGRHGLGIAGAGSKPRAGAKQLAAADRRLRQHGRRNWERQFPGEDRGRQAGRNRRLGQGRQERLGRSGGAGLQRRLPEPCPALSGFHW